jgi:phosphatidylglycerophosphate synthase
MRSGEFVRPGGQVPVPLGDAAFRVGRPADRDPSVADRDVGMVVLGLGQLGEAIDERDRSREVLERQLALECALPLAPSLANGHDTEYGVWRRSRKQTRVPPPAVVLANFAAGLAAAVAVTRGEYTLAAGLLVLKTVLDGADGALARATGRVTAVGRYLDSECDLVVNAALFGALGYATHRPLLAAVAFLASTIVLSLNYNLRRLSRSEPARTSGTPDGGGVLRSIYGSSTSRKTG